MSSRQTAQSDKVSAGQVTVFGSTTTTNLGKSTSAPGSTKITPSSILGGATTGVTLNFQASLSSTAAPAITTTAGPAITTLDITTSSATPSSTSESQTPSSTSATETASSTSESQTQTLSSTTATETLSSTSLTSSTLTATSTTATCRTPGVMTTAKAFDGYPINMVDYVPDLQGNAYLISMTSGQVLRQEAGYQVPALGVFATVNQALQYKGMTIDANNEIWILDSTWGYTHVRANGSTSYFGFNKVGASNSSSSWTMIPYNFNKVHYDVVNNKIYAIAADQGGPPLPYVFRFDPTTGLTDVLANSSDFSVRSGWTWPPDNYPRAMALDYNNGYIYVGSEGPRIRRLSTSASQGSHTFVNITMPSTAVVASTGFAMAVGTTNGHLYACFPFTSIQRTLCYEWSSVGASGSPTLISNYTYNDIDTQASLRVSSDRVYFMNSNLNVKAQTAPIDDWNNWKDAVDAGIFVTSPDMVPYGADAVFVFGPGLTANGGNYSLHMFKLDSRYKWGMYAVNINSQAVTAGMAAGSGAADPTRGYLYWVHNSDIVRYDVNNVSAVTTTTVVSGLSSINKVSCFFGIRVLFLVFGRKSKTQCFLIGFSWRLDLRGISLPCTTTPSSAGFQAAPALFRPSSATSPSTPTGPISIRLFLLFTILASTFRGISLFLLPATTGNPALQARRSTQPCYEQTLEIRGKCLRLLRSIQTLPTSRLPRRSATLPALSTPR